MKNRRLHPTFRALRRTTPRPNKPEDKSLELVGWRLRRYTPPPYATPKTGL